jgi:Zn-dependent M28 family amino/carboxypeptidase
LYVTGVKSDTRFEKKISTYPSTKDFTLLMGHDGTDGKQDWTYSSDHASFHKKNIPFLYFGVEDHKDYHKPTDDFENIQPEFYKRSVQTIISVFEQIDVILF